MRSRLMGNEAMSVCTHVLYLQDETLRNEFSWFLAVHSDGTW